MKTYPISSNQTEEIDFKVDGERFTLVHWVKIDYNAKVAEWRHGVVTRAVFLLHNLYSAIQLSAVIKYICCKYRHLRCK